MTAVRRTLLAMTLAVPGFLSTGRGEVTDGLVAYWPLDGDGEDATGNGHDGEVLGGVLPFENRFGDEDGALLFPGTPDGHVFIEDSVDLQITGPMTISAWVLLDLENADRNGRIVSKQGGGGSRSWSLNIENAGVPATFQVAADGNTIVGVNDFEPLPQDEWVHMCGVYRPGEALEVYVNGELAEVNEFDIPDSQFSDNGLPVLIGSRNNCGNCGWLGAIDDVAIWDRDLDEDEVIEAMEREFLLDAAGCGAAPCAFARGDDDGNGQLEITDPVSNLSFQFLGEFQPTCLDALDFDDNGAVEITDPIGNLTYQFLGGPGPAAPFPDCGADPSDDTLTCESFARCEG